MDNDEAEKRHGAAPTYKRVKGFPASGDLGPVRDRRGFRGGDKHSDTAPKTLRI